MKRTKPCSGLPGQLRMGTEPHCLATMSLHYLLHHNRHYDNRNSYNEETFGPSARTYQETHSDQATRRDLMPGHVHTLGILRHSRSRHDKDNAETFGEEGELGNEGLLINPTGDPMLDAKMMEEQEELAKR